MCTFWRPQDWFGLSSAQINCVDVIQGCSGPASSYICAGAHPEHRLCAAAAWSVCIWQPSARQRGACHQQRGHGIVGGRMPHCMCPVNNVLRSPLLKLFRVLLMYWLTC